MSSNITIIKKCFSNWVLVTLFRFSFLVYSAPDESKCNFDSLILAFAKIDHSKKNIYPVIYMLSHTKKSRKRNPRKKNAKKQNIKINSPEQKNTQTVIINNPAPKKRQSRKAQMTQPPQRPMQYPIMPFPIGGSQPVIVNSSQPSPYPQFSSIAEQLKEQQAKIQKDMETFYNVQQQASRENDNRLLGIEQQIRNSQQELARRLASGGGASQPAFGVIKEDLDQLQQQWQSQFQGQDERFKEIEDRVRANVEQQSAFQSQIQPFFQETDERIQALSEYGRQTQDFIDQSEKRRIAEIEQVNQQREVLAERIAKLEESRDSIIQRLETEDNPKKIANLEAKLLQTVEFIDSAQKEMLQDLSNFNTRIEALEEAPQQSSFQTPGSVETARTGQTSPSSPVNLSLNLSEQTATPVKSPAENDEVQQVEQPAKKEKYVIPKEVIEDFGKDPTDPKQVKEITNPIIYNRINDLIKSYDIGDEFDKAEKLGFNIFSIKQDSKGELKQPNDITSFDGSKKNLVKVYQKLKEFIEQNDKEPMEEMVYKGKSYWVKGDQMYKQTPTGRKGELYGTLLSDRTVQKYKPTAKK